MDLKETLRLHAMWVNNDDGGKRADLRYADLRDADLRDADLRYANLRYANLRYANLRYANLRYANLQGTDLRGANLQGTDLRGADLRGAVGEMRYVKSMQLEIYPVTYTSDVLQIGCQRHDIEKWWGFSDAEIRAMDGRAALDWWSKWKGPLRQTIELSPADPTGAEQ